MLSSTLDLQVIVRERTAALEICQRRLARRESDLRALNTLCAQLTEQLAAEKRRADTLAALSERYGAR